jgi:hypothetical protein
MNLSIWKYQFDVSDAVTITMPSYAKLLHVGVQLGRLTVWALVDPEEKMVKRTIRIFGTGHPIPEDEIGYVGTVIQGMFVWHIFDAGE